MSQSVQQRSLQRKLIYFFLILVLFFATLGLRQGVLASLAERIGTRETTKGQVELTGSALRLTLTGSRGLVVCFLWYTWQDKMKRNEWNELELIVNTLTKLQPHFITPWLFQSWNLAYNVSAESDRIKDKYFYITRGIQLLAEGERQNQNNPELLEHLGIFYRDKLGTSDQNLTLRSLLQLSCIDPQERKPENFRPRPKDRSYVDLDKLQEFCEKHPFLVRRLYESLGCKTPKQLVDFLEDNRRLPSRFEDRLAQDAVSSPLKPAEERFPLLPPGPSPHVFPGELTNDSELGDDFDCTLAARAWFNFSQEPLYLPQPHKPRGTLAIFQCNPAWAQSARALQFEKEGWFDEDQWPWPAEDWFKDSPPPPGHRQSILLGETRPWAMEGWAKAHSMFQDLGRDAGLYKTPEQEASLSAEEQRHYQSNREVTNFEHWLVKTEVESTRQVVTARKRFYEARSMFYKANFAKELTRYEDPAAFGPPETWAPDRATGWLKILYEHPKFRSDKAIQEETFEMQVRYQNALQKVRVPVMQQRLSLEAVLAIFASPPMTAAYWVPPVQTVPLTLPPFKGPCDVAAELGHPLVPPYVMKGVLDRRGISTNSRLGRPTSPAETQTNNSP